MKKRFLSTAFLAIALCFCISATACATAQSPNLEAPPQSSFEEIQPPSEPENSGNVETDSTPETSPPDQTPPTSNGENNETSTPPTTQTPSVKEQARYIVCTGDNVNLRSGAGTSYAVLGQAEKGETYAIVGQTGKWYKTYYKNKTAYFYAEYASILTLEKSENSDVESVINEGYKLLGVPYVYGAVRLHDGQGNFLKGFTTQKFDCSSLVQYAFYQGAGTILQTTTRTQFKQGEFVAKSELERGDCIYFTNETRQYKKGIERVGHVAIYLGNNYILHTASDYARIEKISQQRWNFYIEARRFV
jgi:cell wall-associated NlpC family hydrolase